MVGAAVESHFISPAALDVLLREAFTPDDFEAFLAERQRTIQDAIEDLLVNERLDLPPKLRELDAAIEAAELSLREVIAGALDNDPGKLPSHVLQKAEERIQIAARRNPSLDLERYRSLTGKLEYCDLRELQDTITSRALWSLFEAGFGTKEMLATRFGQLADLRNGIRHSRTVDEVTLKDGEAALLWFRGTIAKNRTESAPTG